MRLACLLAALALAPTPSAQVYEDWVSTFDDFACLSCTLVDHDVDAEGNAVVVGSLYQTVYLAKFGPGGDLLWNLRHDVTGTSIGGVRRVVVGAEGEIYVVSNVPKPQRQDDIAVLRFEADGAFAWELTLDGPNDGDWPGNADPDDHYGDRDQVWDAALMPDGALAIAATTGYAMSDFWTLVIEPAGTVRWTHSFDAVGRGMGDEGHAVAVDCAGRVHVLGTSEYVYTPHEGEEFVLRHLQVVSYAADGAFLRADHYGKLEGSHETGYVLYGMNAQSADIVADCEGNVYATGAVESTGSDSYDWVAFRIDPDVDGLAWVRPHGGFVGGGQASSDFPRWLALAIDGGLYVAGDVLRAESSPYRTRGTEVVRLDAVTGSVEWSRRNYFEDGNPTSDVGGLVADATGVVVADRFVGLNSSGSGGSFRKYAPSGAVAWGLNVPFAGSAQPSRPGNGLSLDPRSGVLARFKSDAGVGVARLGQGEPPLPLRLVVTDAATEAAPGATATFSLTASSGETPVQPFDLLVDVSLGGTSVLAETVAGSDGTYRFDVPAEAAPGTVYTFSFSARAEGYEPSDSVQTEVAVVAPPAVAEVQVQHASAALRAFGPLEVYLDGAATPDFTFSYPDATIAVALAADVAHTVRARLAQSGVEYTFTAPPLAAGRYTATLAGIPEPVLVGYAQNPDGIDRALRMILAAFGLPAEGRTPGGQVPVAVVHAVTDAPAIDVVTEDGIVLATRLAYGEASAPVSLPPTAHRVEVRRADTGALLEAVRFDLSGAGADPVTITATGFLDPAANQNGPGFAVVAVDASGDADPGVVVTGAEALGLDPSALTVGPNPARSIASVAFSVAEGGPVRLSVVDALGREVAVLAEGARPVGAYQSALDTSGLAPGLYLVRLATGSGVATRRLTVVR